MRLPVSIAALLVFAGPAFSQPTSFSACPQFFPAQPPAVSSFSRLRELCFDEFAVLHSGQTKTPIYVVGPAKLSQPHKHWVCAVSPTAPSPENQFTSH